AVHLFVLEGLSRILTAAGATQRAMRNRHAMRSFEPAEIPALHRTREAAPDGNAGHVDLLAFQKMRSENLVAHFQEIFLVHPKLRHFAFGLDGSLGEMAAFGLA